jgi:WD40 repeat protein
MLRIGFVARKYIDIVGLGQKDFWSCIEFDLNDSIISGCFNLKRSIPLYLRDKNMDYVCKELIQQDKFPKTESQINSLVEYFMKLAFNDPEIDIITLKNLSQCRLKNEFRNFFTDILNVSIKLQNKLRDKTFINHKGDVVSYFTKNENGKIEPYFDNEFINSRIKELSSKSSILENSIMKTLKKESKNLSSKINTSEISNIIFPNVIINDSKEKYSFDDAIENIKSSKKSNIALIGDGGMGKTILLKNYWVTLTNNDKVLSIPLFIDLSEYNSEDNNNFIKNTILKDYLYEIKPSDDKLNELYKIMKTTITDGDKIIPSVILLLDGINEVKDNINLIREIEDLNDLEGTKIILSSRNNFINTYSWNNYNLFLLTELNENQIINYLEKSDKIKTKVTNIDKTLNNPMILTLYTDSCDIVKEFKNNEYVNIKDFNNTKGEIFWNYIESNLIKKINDLCEYEVYYYDFLFKHVIAYIGYSMEKNDQFTLTERQLRELSIYAIKKITDEKFKEYFYIYDDSLIIDKILELKQFNRFKNFLKDIQIIKQHNKKYSFSHQHFRDYFSAVYLINEIEFGIYNENIPKSLSEELISDDVLIFIGEILGEHRNIPKVIEGHWTLDNDTLLIKFVTLTKGKSYKDFGFALFNALKILHLVRGELSGINLTNLDLRNVKLNNIKFNSFSEIGVLSTKFDKSIILEDKLLPESLFVGVSDSKYYINNKKILIGSNDGVIREWCTRENVCRNFYLGHTGAITSVMYDKYGEKILSSSHDGTIREWCTTTKKCIMIYEGHDSPVNNVTYNKDFSKILSVSDDGTVREWSTENGKTIKIFHKEYSGLVTFSTYSPDNRKILITSSDATVREYSVDTNNYVAIYKGHAGVVNFAMYSPSGDRIITTSNDTTIREYLTKNSSNINIYTGHKKAVNYADYNLNGNKLVSASNDGLIIEWNVTNGSIIKIFEGHESSVNTVMYNVNNEKILSSSDDGTIKEWSVKTGKCINTYKIIPGLFLYNCVFNNLSSKSKINDTTINILHKYGVDKINIDSK